MNQAAHASTATPWPALDQPRISVLVCNYNYAHYLGAALDSVLAQRSAAHEIIVVDDGSTDGSAALVRGYAGRGVLVCQANGGQLAAYNTALAQATGDVLLFLDSDDLLLPDALREIARRFAQGVVKVHFPLTLIGPDGEALGGTVPTQLDSGAVATRLLRHGVPHASPPASGNAYRRDVLAALFPLPLDATDRHAADFFCIYGSTLFGTVATCPQPLGQYRLHRRPPVADGSPSLTFGNAEQGHVLADRVQQRMARLSDWIHERTAGTMTPPRYMLDFSIEKTAYASAALLHGGRGQTRLALRRLPQLLRALWWRDGMGRPRKLGLAAWALLLLLAPRPLALRAARFVCDPGSRGAQPVASAGAQP